ncbi:dicarboxylate transporter 2.1, chloroplastic-like [Ipomoea triloba]|uniref:dicarboxylate transporter 2.1, chloroplastic-like n=1 Tax=Ipomoea triloba TaxID=35885 RepID=UPI00125D85F3|nr:dicarboxylate transporter 2.1, chloroplastic-like [Ipomoea triloba]XP_031107223.1 dicarboxylate transporter 2.1, chloroplastic-like [Ipomoea triloba]
MPMIPETSTATTRRRFSLLPWKGVRLIPLAISISIGLIFRFAIPKPHSVPTKGWQLLALFLTTISGLILTPLPVGGWAFTCLTLSVLTKTLTFSAAFSAFTNEVIWLIVSSFFFSRGFIKTGLGDRLAMLFVRFLGKSTLGLSYGLVLSEAIISPAMPSSTARAGGIFLPIIKSLASSADSHPKDPSSRKLGAYLVQSQLQASSNSSALFLTAAAQNLLCIKLAEGLGVKVSSRWVTWLKASCFPALVALLATPVVVYKIFPPEMKKTPDAPEMARRRMKEMGRMKFEEWIMVGTMLIMVALWIAGDSIGIASVVTAMLGLTLLMLCGVLDWDDCLSEKSAWDTLTWFGVLIGMATQLTALGVIKWMSDVVAGFLKSHSISSFWGFVILQAAYFFIHYLFAGQTAHVAALYSAFLGMHLASKVPGLFAALALAYNTNLNGALTHYSSGQAAVYYGGGFVELRDAFKLGIAMAVINITLWVLIGAGWWKVLGLY